MAAAFPVRSQRNPGTSEGTETKKIKECGKKICNQRFSFYSFQFQTTGENMNLLIKLFIRNPADVTSSQGRTAYGIFCGWYGILTNLALCLVKISVGFLTGSIAVTADAVNNLSDAGSSVITLFGFKFADKPADDEHPFGHGRLEYVAGLIVAVIIIAVGLDFLKLSFERLIHPSRIEMTTVALVLLLATLPVKLWMFFVYRGISRKIASKTIHAVAFDSLSDILTTLLVIVSLVISRYTSFPVDGLAGLLVAIFIILGGAEVVKEIINPLVGECPDRKLVAEIRERLLQCRDICGVHDIIVHNYGPDRYFATAHAEVNPEKNDMVQIHDALEAAEVEIARHMPVRLLLHCDPFFSQDPELKRWRTLAEDLIGALDPELKLYDFRLEKSEEHILLNFQLLVPRKFFLSNAELIERITGQLREHDRKVDTKIQITHSFV